MTHYRIRKEGLDFPVAGLDALERQVLDGGLRAEDKVFDPETGEWRRAAELPSLDDAFHRRKTLLAARERAAREPEHVDTSALEPPDVEAVARNLAQAEGLVELDPDSLVPVQEPTDEGESPAKAEDQRTPEPWRPAVGRDDQRTTEPRKPHIRKLVIGGGNLKDRGAQPEPSPAPPPPIPPEPELKLPPLDFPPQPPRPASARSGRNTGRIVFLFLVLIGSVAVWLMLRPYFSAPPTHMMEPPSTRSLREPARPAPTGGTPPVESPYQEFYDNLEADLRDRMKSGVAHVARPQDLEDALLVEFSRLPVDVTRVRAPIREWVGRRQDVPKAAEIHVWFQEAEDQLDRDLGSIGLVVGKYVHGLSLDLISFRVYIQGSSGGSRVQDLDPNHARNFYLRRISLLRFLEIEEPAQ